MGRKKMTYNSVLAQLADVTYSDAISHYNAMKIQFFNQFEKGLKTEFLGQGEKFINDWINNISNTTGQAWPDVTQFIGKVQAALSDKIENNTNTFPQLEQELDKKYSELSDKAKNELNQYIQNILQLDNLVLDLLQDLSLNGPGAYTTQDILSWTYAYVRKWIFTKKSGGLQANNFNSSAILAGYFTEALFNKSAQDLCAYLENVVGTLNTGSLKPHGVDTAMDQFFDFTKGFSDGKKTFEEAVQLDNATLTQGFGAQVKAYQVPWQSKSPRNSYSVGSRASLLDQFVKEAGGYDKQLGWIKGVRFLEHHVRQVLGDNVMYITGRYFNWTSELIASFRENQYFLAFNYEKVGVPGKGVSWQRINMSKQPDS